MVAPGAFDHASASALLGLVPEPLVLTDEEALTTFCANSIVVGRTVVMPAGAPQRVVAQLAAWDFEVVEVEVGEFHKGGGSVRCLTNPVDMTLARDVPVVPGGEVVLPPLS
jgi:N-dimethylarginine dimethylaminohydrolase